jgi:hypothetical protein
MRKRRCLIPQIAYHPSGLQHTSSAMVKFASSLSLMQAASVALAASYQVTDTIVGHGFNAAFSYIAEADPTHGRVYVSSR